ncbi:MAG: thioredoxin-disulfide reductase [Lachnospiraceae bacterium]|nr:thioredoxin-disulfide reductase [Lachnospiraceae bacterium]
MKYDIIIIGAGPAGLSAAVYAKRAGFRTLVLDKSPVSGGQVLSTYEVDNYLGIQGVTGMELSEKFKNHAMEAGAEFVCANVLSIDAEGDTKVVHTEKEDYEAAAIIFAVGAHHAKLGVKGEEELTGMGVSYCATCDGAFFKNRKVAVVGGGDVAIEDAIFLARGCEKVYVIHRRDTFRAAHSLVEKARQMDNIEFIIDTTVSEICGEDMVEKLVLSNVKTKEQTELEVNGIFIAVGIVPETEILQDVVKMDEKGYVLSDELGSTNIPGVFVAGDCKQKRLRQIITAVADGANAVTGVEDYFNR